MFSKAARKSYIDFKNMRNFSEELQIRRNRNIYYSSDGSAAKFWAINWHALKCTNGYILLPRRAANSLNWCFSATFALVLPVIYRPRFSGTISEICYVLFVCVCARVCAVRTSYPYLVNVVNTRPARLFTRITHGQIQLALLVITLMLRLLTGARSVLTGQ